jgi:hypothetical protein
LFSLPLNTLREIPKWTIAQLIEGCYVRPWSLNLLFYRRGFGLVVSVAGSTPGLVYSTNSIKNCLH